MHMTRILCYNNALPLQATRNAPYEALQRTASRTLKQRCKSHVPVTSRVPIPFKPEYLAVGLSVVDTYDFCQLLIRNWVTLI